MVAPVSPNANPALAKTPAGASASAEKPSGASAVSTTPQPLAADRRSFKLWGDPHAVAGDGKKFDNELLGTITQMKSASGDFELQTTQAHAPTKRNVTVNTAAALQLGKNVVSYDVTKNLLVLNKQRIELKNGTSMNLPGGGAIARNLQGQLSITSAKGDVVNLHVAHWGQNGPPYLNIDGSLGPARVSNDVQGALGAFHNGSADANADFIGRDGKTYDAAYDTGKGTYKSIVSKDTYNQANVEAFEKSWRVGGKSLLDQNTPPSEKGIPGQGNPDVFKDPPSAGQNSKSKLNLPNPAPAPSPEPVKGPASNGGENSLPAKQAQDPISVPPANPGPPVSAAPVANPANASLSQAIASTPVGQALSLGVGTYAFNNFGSNPTHQPGSSSQIGLDLSASTPGIAGAGIDRTVIAMAPHTSTHASDIPTTDWQTNQYSLMRVTGSPNLHDFTLQSTDQGHLYNGLRLDRATNARITNVKVTGVPGNNHFPPGETFGINDYRTTNALYKNVEVNGSGLGAAGFGANDSNNVTIDHGYFHDNPYSAGATFWQTNNVTLIDVTSKNNHAGLNFERVSGTVNIIRPVITGNTRPYEISIGTDNSNAIYNIQDPVLPPGQKLRILVGKNYLGTPSPQQRSNIHIYQHGVDVTSQLVQWI